MKYPKTILILVEDDKADLPCDFYHNPSIFQNLRAISVPILSDFHKKYSNHVQITSFLEKTVRDGEIWTKRSPEEINKEQFAENRMFISFSYQKKIADGRNCRFKVASFYYIYREWDLYMRGFHGIFTHFVMILK